MSGPPAEEGPLTTKVRIARDLLRDIYLEARHEGDARTCELVIEAGKKCNEALEARARS